MNLISGPPLPVLHKSKNVLSFKKTNNIARHTLAIAHASDKALLSKHCPYLMTFDNNRHLVRIQSFSNYHCIHCCIVLDTLTISGVASKLPFTVTVTAKDVWTFTLNSAFSLGAFPPVVFVVAAFRLLA